MISGPAFSICIPNYNYERFVGLAIRSVLEQSYTDFEVVVVDNCSTDKSWETIQAIAAVDRRVRAYRNVYNIGFGPNLDRAVSYAQNEFIVVFSSDDLMKPTALEEYAKVIRKLGPSAEQVIICSEIDVIDGTGLVIGAVGKARFIPAETEKDVEVSRILADPKVTAFAGASVFKQAFERLISPCAFTTTCYSRRVYNSVGGFSSIHPTGPDAHLVFKALSRGTSVVFVEEQLFSYRMHGQGQVFNAAAHRGLNTPINYYLLVNSYSAQQLSAAYIDKQAAIRTLVKRHLILEGIKRVESGDWLYAAQHLFFSLASYPGQTARTPLAYALLISLAVGPLGTLLTRGYRAVLRSPSQQ